MGQFRFLTAGESHGPGLTTIVEGIPAGGSLSEGYIWTGRGRRPRGPGGG
ncbi:MAG: chorismate synthase, partial [Chloroflexi bacterium]|nr:chorismate synthase [Chloroflexota bacterium]